VAEERTKPRVSVPVEGAERPGVARIGIIAGVCFVVGAVWPTLAGVRLVPEPPTKSEAEEGPTDKANPRPRRAIEDESKQEVPAMQLEPLAKEVKPAVAVEEPLVVNCRDENDRRLATCDKPGFDAVGKDRLMALIGCEGAAGLDGTLSVGFDLDFRAKKIRRIMRGKSTTLDDTTADALIECAKREFMSATLEGVEHTHAYYLVFYGVRFQPNGPNEKVAHVGDPTVEVSGKATVIWNSARMRSSPDEGEVKATLMYGAQVVVTGRQGDWYRVRYDAKGSEAWIHKNALAL
jgi:hypothetical protein